MPKTISAEPTGLRPYLFHGLEFVVNDGQGTAECPCCGKSRKFSVNIETSEYRCWSMGCGVGQGNARTWLRWLWAESDRQTGDYSELVKDRGLLLPETLMHWGAVRSITTGEWLVPGYGSDGKLNQLYRYVQAGDRKLLLPTPTCGAQLFGANLYDPSCGTVYLCEGPWDGMALWEVLGQAKQAEEGLTTTANRNASLLSSCSVLAVPGCDVMKEDWIKLFDGKRVVMLYDNDHPKPDAKTNKVRPGAGWHSTQRVSRLIARVAKSVSYLRWGEGGYDPDLPDGHDVRDWLAEGNETASRVRRLEELLDRVVLIPEEWAKNLPPAKRDLAPAIGCLPCGDYAQLNLAWRKALKWRESMDDVLSVMLAVSLSTEQIGDQLFLMVIGDAGSGKTRLCDGLLVSKGCYPLEHLTGFHSGWKDDSGKDFSLLSRVNRKTMITPEGDVMISSPHFAEIMSQQRRIFDGTSGASYKNRDEDLRYTGLRTPWIIAGTPALLDADQSRLGDRFLKVFIEPPDDDEKRNILRRVGYTALRSVKITSDGTPDKHVDKALYHAYQLTGGYVDWLRSNTDLLSAVGCGEDVLDRCAALGEFVAEVRARPGWGRLERHETKELLTRLTHQFVRLACCMAVVLNRKSVDDEVLRRVKKVALDTGHGHVLTAVTHLYARPEGIEPRALAGMLGQTEDRVKDTLRFLTHIKTVERFVPPSVSGIKSRPRWRLTGRMRDLYADVMLDERSPGRVLRKAKHD